MDRLATSVNIDVAAWTTNPVIKLPARAITDVAVDFGDQDVNYVIKALFCLFVGIFIFISRAIFMLSYV